MVLLSYATLCRRKTASDRMNGCSLPINLYQLIALTSIVLFSLFHFAVLLKYLPDQWRTTITAVSVLLLVIEVVSMLVCTLCDPADPALMSNPSSLYGQPKDVFDRAKQGHVITSSGYCQICATTVDKSSRHCAQCNKCVLRYDHHCDYINNCVGVRNYGSYMCLVLTSLLYAVCVVCTILYCLYKLHSDPKLLLQELGYTQYTLFVAVPLEALLFTLWLLLLLGLIALMLIANLARLHLYLIIRGWTTWDFYCRPPDERKMYSYWNKKKPTQPLTYSVELPESPAELAQAPVMQHGLCADRSRLCSRQNKTQPIISDNDL